MFSLARYALPCLITLAGCTPRQAEQSAAPSPTAPPDPWVITTTTPGGDYRPTYLGNGYLGQLMDAAGLGMTGGSPPTGEGRPVIAHPGAPHLSPGPQPASLAGLYDRGRLVTLPPLFPLRVERDEQPFGADLSRISNYQQTLDLRRGLLSTRGNWNGQPVEITAFVSRDTPELAVCRVEAPAAVRVQSSAEGGGSVPAVSRASRLLSPDGPSRPGTTATTFVTAVTAEPVSGAAEAALQRTLPSSGGADGVFPALLQRHTAAWERLWASDIEIEGSPADQQLVRALMYQVLASLREEVAGGFPPMGLSNPAAFDGHVFWDADTWIYPALLPLHPKLARTILDYRYRTLPGAKANAAAEGMRGASYAWESADTGREVATLETRHGRHVNSDIALAHWQYYLATGDRAWLRDRAWPVLAATADYWVSRATPAGSVSIQNPKSKTQNARWEIRRVSTPDENAGLVDNSAWTNFGARENMRRAAQVARMLGLSANPRWQQVADGLVIPRDASGMILEYSGYAGRPAKQADTLLLLFPGEMPLPRAEQERMFRYYVDRTIQSGPAMTESVHAVIAARLGQPEEAYRRFRLSVDPFVRPPFHSFSEKRTRDHLHFLTGAAGSLQAVLYGFAGLHLQDSLTPVFRPQLPPAWTGLTLRNFHWRGKRYDVVVRRGQPARLTSRSSSP